MQMSKPKVSRGHITPKDKATPPQINVFPLHRHLLKLLIILFLTVTTLVVFSPLRNYEFINLDDDVYVYDNPQIKTGLTLKGVIWAFTTMENGFWHPLTWLSHMLDYEFYGLSAGGHHLTNVLLHIANTLLLFLALERMTRGFWVSSFVAALFALHPLHVESVAWVAERKDVLSTFFWMLTLWTYVRYTERRTLNRYLVVLSSLALGLLSKAMLVTLPCVMLLLDYWPLGRLQFGQSSSPCNSSTPKPMNRKDQRSFTHRLVLEKVPFFALATIFCLLTFLAEEREGALEALKSLPLGTRIANALVSYISYIGKMIWPHRLAILYPHPGMVPMWQAAGAGFLLVCVLVLAVRAARKYPYLGVGWLWYLGTLVPVMGLVQVGVHGMADRYTYVPLIGLFIMVAWGVPDILAGWRYRKTVLSISAGLLLSIFMVVTSLQIRQWHDSITLFTHTLNVTTRNSLIHNNLGIALAQQGKHQGAIAHFAEALRIKPDYGDAHNNLGVALAHQGKHQEAIAHFAEALRINPHFADAHHNLRIAQAQQGKHQEAIAHFAEALRTNPHLAEAHHNLGIVLARQGKNQEAIAHYTEALRINPDYMDAHNDLGIALALQGRHREAIAHFAEAVRIKPDFAQAHNNLGVALVGQGKNQEAIAHFAEAVRIKPDFAEAHFSLGLAYFKMGNRASALEEYKILQTIKPDLANVLSQKILK